MFSGALYKQSWKANWIQWLSIAIVSAFVLTIIMLISGGDKLGSLTSAFTETFIKDSLDSEFQNTAINYHNISYENLESFDEAFLNKYQEILQDENYDPSLTESYIQTAYEYAVLNYQSKIDLTIKSIDTSITEESKEYLELMGMSLFIVVPNLIDIELNEVPPKYDIMPLVESFLKPEVDVVKSLERTNYRNNHTRTMVSIFLASSLTSEQGIESIVKSLEEANVDKEMYLSFGYDYQTINNLSNAAIITFRSRLDYELELIDIADFNTIEEYQMAVLKARDDLQKDITKTLLSRIPDSLSESMEDMKDYDFYTMTVGNMYYKIVGLLIAIVFVIVIGINLISGQVDSGSMVYILSTGTRRKTITFTQMVFFITSTIALYLLSTIISVVMFVISPPVSTVIKLEHVVLFNVGLLLVTITLGAIVFLASCIFNRSKHAIAIGGGFTILTLVFTLLGMFATKSTPSVMRMESLAFFNNISLVTLFDIDSIIAGTTAYIWKFGILIIIAIIAYIIGIYVFNKKDLPL